MCHHTLQICVNWDCNYPFENDTKIVRCDGRDANDPTAVESCVGITLDEETNNDLKECKWCKRRETFEKKREKRDEERRKELNKRKRELDEEEERKRIKREQS